MAHLNRQIQPQKSTRHSQPIKRQTQSQYERRKKKVRLGSIVLIFSLIMFVIFGCALFVMNKETTAKMHNGIHRQVMVASEEQTKGQKNVNHFNQVVNKYCTDDNGDDLKNPNLNVKQYHQAKKDLTRAYDELPNDYKTNFSNLETRILLMLQIQLDFNNYFKNKAEGVIRDNLSPATVLNNNIEISSDLNTIIDQTNSDNPFVKRMISNFTVLGNDAKTLNKAYNQVSDDMQQQPNLQTDNVANSLYQQIVYNQTDNIQPQQLKDITNTDLNGQYKDMYAYVYSKLSNPQQIEIAHCFIIKNNVSASELKDDAKISGLHFKWNAQTKFLTQIANSKALSLEIQYYQNKAKGKSTGNKDSKTNSSSAQNNNNNQQNNSDNKQQNNQNNNQNNNQQNNSDNKQQNNQNNNQQNNQNNNQQNNQNNNQQNNQNNNQTEYDPDQLTPPADNDPSVQDPVLQGAVNVD